MIFNTLDGIVQNLSYGLLQFPIHNRNMESSSEKPLGYIKRISSESRGKSDKFYSTYSSYNTTYEFEWDLILNDTELELLLSIIYSNYEDIKTVLRSSVRLYNPIVAIDKLILFDEKIKDPVTGNYEYYSISISEVGDITDYSATINKLTLKSYGVRVI